MSEEKVKKPRRYKGKVVEPKPELSLDEKVLAAKERIKMLETQLSNKLTELSALEDEKLELRGGPEDFAYTHKRYLERVKEEANKEAVSHERAVAFIQERSKMSPIDQVMGAKPGIGNRRPVFNTKKEE